MSSEKRKETASKIKNSKAPLKQRTLLDSFVSRVQSKVVPLELGSVEANAYPLAVTDLQPGGSSTAIDTGIPVKEEKDNLDALGSSRDHHDSPSLDNDGRRSPSVVIIEDTPPHHPTIPQQMPVINLQESPAENGSGKSKHRPIVIDSSPMKCPSRDDKPIHPFFLPKSMRAVQVPEIHPVLPGKRTAGTEIPSNASIFYPRGMPQHIRGPQTTFARDSPMPRRPHNTLGEATDKVANYDFLKSITRVEGPLLPSHRVQLLPVCSNDPGIRIPGDIKTSYPAVARLIDLKSADKPTSNRPWADRWRPSCAQEVLGNEQSAIYLRDWLRALELQLGGNGANFVPTDSSQDHKKAKVNGKTISITRGIKRPLVIRSVDKTRRKKSRLDSDEDEDNWIVYTDEEDVPVDNDQTDEFGEIIMDDPPASSPSSSVHESSQEVTDTYQNPFYLGQLHNTILLAGPPGCGKTASVYACAEELGWDIFEVYPGIGRRSGASIDNLIGEVGKNHLVVRSRTSGDSLGSFLQSKTKRKSVEDREECNALSQISPRKKSTIEVNLPAEDKQSNKSVQQSLILLEEVDILFKEDTNFWTTVTKIIRECKRPVVCTCNDLSLVPVQDLPLQATLLYSPCPEGPAACYLQALCGAEGYAVSWKDLVTLYSNPQRTYNHRPDLRATINDLQAISADAIEAGVEETSQEERHGTTASRISVKGSDFLSFLDGSLDRNIASTYSMLADLGNHVPSEDDETGHLILFDRHAEDTARFEIYDRQREILSAAAQLVNSVFKVDLSRDERMETTEKCGQKIREGQRVAAREICRMAEDAVSISLEYLPYVRQIVEAEDVLEVKEQEKRPRMRRTTRNSARSQYVRMVELTEHARDGLEMSRLIA